MAKRAGRPSWFKMFLSQKSLIDAVPDETAGKALKAALQYFDTGEYAGGLDPLSMAVFSALKPYIDEAFDDFQRDYENGKKGGRPKKPPVTPPNPGLPPLTQAEADADAEADAYAEANISFNQSFAGERFENSHSVGTWEPCADRDREEVKRKFLGGELGRGVVLLSDAQFDDLLDKLSLEEFNKYVSIVADMELKGRHYKRKTHYQAILDMAMKDRRIR